MNLTIYFEQQKKTQNASNALHEVSFFYNFLMYKNSKLSYDAFDLWFPIQTLQHVEKLKATVSQNLITCENCINKLKNIQHKSDLDFMRLSFWCMFKNLMIDYIFELKRRVTLLHDKKVKDVLNQLDENADVNKNIKK